MMPRYACITRINFLSLKASAQHDIMNEAWRDFPQIDPKAAKNGPARWEQIARARQLRADAMVAPQREAAKSQTTKSGRAFAGITASEINDWLASLPPVPLHGEA